LFRLDQQGNELWRRTVSVDGTVWSLQPTADGGYVLVSTSDSDPQFFSLVKLGRESLSTPFRRGHTNADGVLDIADVACLLGYLFGPAGEPCKESVAQCLDAADANDDGRLNISDAVMALRHVFMGSELPPPFESCGTDDSEDELGCISFEGCD
jgi:hypothetical protein